MEKEISLVDFAKAIVKKAWLVIVLTVVGAIMAYFVSSFFLSPSYTSKTTLFVKNKQSDADTITSSEISTSKALVDDYIVILESETVLSQVANELNALRKTAGYEFLRQESDYTATSIRGMQDAAAINETAHFYIEVTTNNPQESQLIAQKLADTLIPHIESFTECKSGTVKMLDPAALPSSPSSPSNLTYGIIGALLGLVASMVIVFLLFITDQVIRNEKTLLDAFEDINLLGVIPVISSSNSTSAAQDQSKNQKGA